MESAGFGNVHKELLWKCGEMKEKNKNPAQKRIINEKISLKRKEWEI